MEPPRPNDEQPSPSPGPSSEGPQDIQPPRRKILLITLALLLICLCAFAWLAGSGAHSIYRNYGDWNVGLAIAEYARRNEGRWPSSWNDITPYYKDPIFGARNTIIIRRYFDVAWEINLSSLLENSPSNPEGHDHRKRSGNYLPVVYRTTERHLVNKDTRWYFNTSLWPKVNTLRAARSDPPAE